MSQAVLSPATFWPQVNLPSKGENLINRAKESRQPYILEDRNFLARNLEWMVSESPPTVISWWWDFNSLKCARFSLLPLSRPALLEEAQFLELAKPFCTPGFWHLLFPFPGGLFLLLFAKLAHSLPPGSCFKFFLFTKGFPTTYLSRSLCFFLILEPGRFLCGSLHTLIILCIYLLA